MIYLRVSQIVIIFASIGSLLAARNPPKDEIPGGLSEKEKDAGLEELRHEGYDKDYENFDNANVEVAPAKPSLSCFSVIDKTTNRYGVSKSPEAVEDSGYVHEQKWMYRRSYIGPILDIDYCLHGTNQLIYYSFSICDVNRTVLAIYEPGYTTFGCNTITSTLDWELTCTYFKNGVNEDCISSKISCKKPIEELVEDNKFLKIELLSSILTRSSICIYIQPTLTRNLTLWEENLEGLFGPVPFDQQQAEKSNCDVYYYCSAVTAAVFTILLFCLIVPISEQEVEFRYQNLQKNKKEEENKKAELDYEVYGEFKKKEDLGKVVSEREVRRQEDEFRRLVGLPSLSEEESRAKRKAFRDRKRQERLDHQMLERQKVLDDDVTDAIFLT